MATITNGMTIQAAWFANIDTTGAFIKDTEYLNDGNPINFVVNSSNLAQIDTDGKIKAKDKLEDYADI